ncbi:MAG: hypothetical protein JWO80_1629 [Bryobacterales bacterium]|nr:hypothetical protein [Bryobacterales bacterium]
MSTVINRTQYPRSTGGLLEMTVNFRAIAAFFLGCLTPIPFQSIGIVYIGEVALLAVATSVAFTKMARESFWSPTATRFLVLLALMLTGYVTSDLIRHTPAEDYVRGWSKVVFIMTDFVAIYYLVRRNSSAIPSFLIGYGVSRYVVWVTVYAPILGEGFKDQWKFGAAIPLTLAILCVLAMTKLRVRLVGYAMIALGALHVFLDYRSLGGMCFVLGAIFLATRRTTSGRIVDKRVLSVSAVGCAGVLAYVYLVSQEGHAERRDASNAWRLGTSIALMKGIMRSPLIGSGSWSSDPQMEAWRDEAMESRGVNRNAAGRNDRFTGHSEILQAWYEGGILAVFFFLYYGFRLASTFIMLLRRRVDKLSGIFLFWLLNMTWAFFLSPLNGLVRVEIAFALAIICHLRAEQQEAKASRRTDGAYPARPLLRVAGAAGIRR